jgi:hypothetical protein
MVYGIYHPVFFHASRKPLVWDYFKKLGINPKLEADINRDNPYYVDFLERCKKTMIPEAITMGFKLHKSYNQYFNFVDTHRLVIFHKHDLILTSDFRLLMTQESWDRILYDAHERLYCDTMLHGDILKSYDKQQKKLDSMVTLWQTCQRWVIVDKKKLQKDVSRGSLILGAMWSFKVPDIDTTDPNYQKGIEYMESLRTARGLKKTDPTSTSQ